MQQHSGGKLTQTDLCLIAQTFVAFQLKIQSEEGWDNKITLFLNAGNVFAFKIKWD